MSDRLTKIVTRGGDRGETSVSDGTRLAKNDPRIALIGDVDELNSWVGVVIAHIEKGELADLLTGVQHDLFDLGGALSFPGAPVLSAKHLARLDDAASAMNADLAPLKEFILPGGAPAIAFCHIARTVCRRAERAMAAFHITAPEAAMGLQYLNRLSDVLFITARAGAKRLGVKEVYWRKEKSASAKE